MGDDVRERCTVGIDVGGPFPMIGYLYGTLEEVREKISTQAFIDIDESPRGELIVPKDAIKYIRRGKHSTHL